MARIRSNDKELIGETVFENGLKNIYNTNYLKTVPIVLLLHPVLAPDSGENKHN